MKEFVTWFQKHELRKESSMNIDSHIHTHVDNSKGQSRLPLHLHDSYDIHGNEIIILLIKGLTS